MAKRKVKELTPMQKALRELFEVGACDASPEQILQVAQKHNVSVGYLEGYYFEEIERLED